MGQPNHAVAGAGSRFASGSGGLRRGLQRRHYLIGAGLGALWLAALVVGQGILIHHEISPGEAGRVPEHWPADSSIPPEPGRLTLVLFAHPHCACTRASVGELAGVLAHAEERVAAFVLFLQPEQYLDDWVRSDLWDQAAAIPGTRVVADKEGREARRFGVETSGHAVLYDAAGRLRYGGGITGSRGHAGDNAGKSALIALLTHGSADRRASFVFGCPLFEPARVCRENEAACNP